MMELEKNLVKARRQKGLSQEEVAEKLGVSCKIVHDWEGGKSIPDLYQMEQLLKLYSISFEELMSENAQEAMEKLVQNEPQIVDWTKVWASQYPVLESYSQDVPVEEYEKELGILLEKLQKDQGYSKEDAMLVLKDILGKMYQKKN